MVIVVVVMVIKEVEGGGGGEWEGYSCIRLAGVETNKNSYKSHWQTSAGLYAVWKWEVRKREKSIIIQIQNICWIDWFFHFKDFIYLLFFWREDKGERKRERETSHAPNWGPGPQPRHVPWLGIKLATIQFAGRRSIHWATPARVSWLILERFFLLHAHHQK